jgi:hypothetical protein
MLGPCGHNVYDNDRAPSIQMGTLMDPMDHTDRGLSHALSLPYEASAPLHRADKRGAAGQVLIK